MVESLLFVLVSALLAVHAFLDCRDAPHHQVRRLPRHIWMIAILAVPVGGAVSWFLLGRPVRRVAHDAGDHHGPDAPPTGPQPTAAHLPGTHPAGSRPTAAPPAGSAPPGPRGPDDDPEFLASLERLVRRARSEGDGDDPVGP